MRTTLSLMLMGALVGCGEPGMGLMGAPGDKGDKGDPGDKGDKGDPGSVAPTLLSLTPAQSFVGRSLLVQIAGVGTHFGAESAVAFDDPEIKVVASEAGSSGNLRVTLDVGVKARLGAHDVTVTTKGKGEGGKDEVAALKGGLFLMPSLRVAVPEMGKAPEGPQGGLLAIDVQNLDYRDNPFTYRERVSEGPVVLSARTLSEVRFSAVFLIDPLAAPGTLGLGLSSVDPLGRSVPHVLDAKERNAPRVTPRAATDLALKMTRKDESISAPMESRLYKISTTMDDQVLQLVISDVGAALDQAGVTLAMAGQSGKFSEGRFLSSSINGTTRTALVLLPRKGDYFVSLFPFDRSGGMMGYGYSITPGAATGKSVSLKEPMMPDTRSAPLATLTLDGPHYSTDAQLDTDTDEDFVRLKARKDGRIYVNVHSTVQNLSVRVALYKEDCTTFIEYSRQGQNETAATADTTYCARIFSFSGIKGAYQLVASQDL